MEVRVFKWFGYVSIRPQNVAQWATSLLYSLDVIFWMITMCCEVSYLSTNTTLLSNLCGIP